MICLVLQDEAHYFLM